jgi:hypothetical protein
MSDRSDDMSRLAAREEQKEGSDSDPEGTDASPQEDATQRSESAEDTSASSESDTAENATDRAHINVKDREETLFAYLPERLDRQVETACQSVSLTYQRESGEKLGKNRYLYPIVLMVGADNAVDLSHDEIRDLVERVDEMEDAV